MDPKLGGDVAVATETGKGIGASSGGTPLSADELRRLDAYWRAANYLSVGQIYLLANHCCASR